MAVLSNSTTASWSRVKRGLRFFDERYMKLDAGDAWTFARINGVGGVDQSLAAVLDALRQLDPIVIQAMFVSDARHEMENCGDGAVAAWLTALERTRPARVHVYTIDRPPARASLSPVPRARLREIAEQVRATGIPVDVFTASR
jgi:wyosine [tRNA(Phe)-imidazoG37] synthetase (radical SAM superfamily)